VRKIAERGEAFDGSADIQQPVDERPRDMPSSSQAAMQYTNLT
jgi:hypothetical protein